MVMYIVFQWDTPIQSIECAGKKKRMRKIDINQNLDVLGI